MRADAAFSPAVLHAILFERLGLAPDSHIKVAYSGGLDSHVLLHALAGLRREGGFRLSAIHVDHGLQPQSEAWAQHCRSVCTQLAIPCHVEQVHVERRRRKSLEALARRARYDSLRRHIGAGDVLVTAHHQDDQAETVLLMLMRGSGLHGLAAMPVAARFGEGRLVRPLLSFPRGLLEEYAAQNRLAWIEDQSNRDTRYNRNFIRRWVFPLLRERWPRAAKPLARAAGHCAEALLVLDEIAQGDLEGCRAPAPGFFPSRGESLSVPALALLSDGRLRNLLRYWIRAGGHVMPHTRLLNEILHGLVRRTVSGTPLIRWPGTEIRRYRETLSLMPALARPDPGLSLPWNLEKPLDVPPAGLRLVPQRAPAEGLNPDAMCDKEISVRMRRGGEVCRLPGKDFHQKLKKLYQDRGVPPWERERIPLIYVGEELAAVAGLWVCEPFVAAGESTGIAIALEPL